MDKITKSLLTTFSAQYELNGLSEATQFEHFINNLITTKLFRGSFGLEDIHCGAGNDCGIDGILLTVNGRIVTEDELQDIVDAAGQIDADITFIQSKSSSSFDGAAMRTFTHGVKDFLSDQPKLRQNSKVAHVKALWEQLISMSSFMINRRPLCRLYYACTGKWADDENLRAVIDEGTTQIDSLSLFEETKFEPLGASEIQNLYQQSKNKLSTTITFQNRITLPDIEGVSEAYIGIIPLSEFLKLIQDENQSIHNIFDENVRDFQGNNHVNRQIKNTLKSGKFDQFCVLNNGVTVVATSLTPAGNRFTIRDYQVVNGCQSSHVLHECQQIEGIDSVNVPVRIVITENDDIKTSITLATNSQTEVKAEQLEALNAFQKKLELYFQAESDEIPLYYERRSQQYNSVPTILRSQIISIPTQIKAFASMFLNSPHLVSGYYGAIIREFTGKIFANDHVYSPYYVSALAYYRVEQFLRTGELKQASKNIRYHILLLARLLSMGEDLAPMNSKQMDRKCEEFKQELSSRAIALELFRKAEAIFEKSSLDKTKRQYKAESDTLLVFEAYRKYSKSEIKISVPLEFDFNFDQ
ncbi:MAG: AIPR family protein [Verrucomicrobiota bacterium]